MNKKSREESKKGKREWLNLDDHRGEITAFTSKLFEVFRIYTDSHEKKIIVVMFRVVWANFWERSTLISAYVCNECSNHVFFFKSRAASKNPHFWA